MKIDLIAAREMAKFRDDIKFIAGLELLERVEKAISEGQIKDYYVWYCSDDPHVVDTITVEK